MSLQREATDDEDLETEKRFRSVLRYQSAGQVRSSGKQGEENLLALQARHNLAVVLHRRYLRMRLTQQKPGELNALPMLAMREYQEVIRSANSPKFDKTDLMPVNEQNSLARRNAALFLASSIGALNLAVAAKIVLPDIGDVSIFYPEVGPAPGATPPAFTPIPSGTPPTPATPSEFLAFVKQVAEWAKELELQMRRDAEQRTPSDSDRRKTQDEETSESKRVLSNKKSSWLSFFSVLGEAIYKVIAPDRSGEQPLVAAAILNELKRLESAIDELDGIPQREAT